MFPFFSAASLITVSLLLICLLNSVPSSAISKSLEPVTGQLSNTIAAKLTAVEVTLKDNVSKVVKSKVGGETTQHPDPRPSLLCLFLVCLFFRLLNMNVSCCCLFPRTRQTPLVEPPPKPCRGPSRRRTKRRSRALCFLCLSEAASPCFNRSMTASNKAPKNVRRPCHTTKTHVVDREWAKYRNHSKDTVSCKTRSS